MTQRRERSGGESPGRFELERALAEEFAALSTASRHIEHRFSGRPVSYHVLCASHDGEVAVELWAAGQEMIGSTNACAGEPFFTVEYASFGSGTKQVELRVQPSGGAEGLVYVVDGEI